MLTSARSLMCHLMIRTVLIANRGEIAVRVIRACRGSALETAVVHSYADAAPFTRRRCRDRSRSAAPARDVPERRQGRRRGAHRPAPTPSTPGYGFLAENAAFAEAVAAAGLICIGPPAEAIARDGRQGQRAQTAARAGVPVVPGTEEPVTSPTKCAAFAAEHGYPVVIKAAAGGGGQGMRVVARRSGRSAAAIEAARREAGASFGDDHVYVEKYLERPRHVEVQVLGDAHGAASRSGSAIAPCSVATRSSSRKRPSPGSRRSSRWPGATPPSRSRAPSATPAPGRSSSCSRASAVLLPRDEHAPAGRASRDRDGVRASTSWREQLRIAAGEPLRRQDDVDATRARHRVPDQRRGSGRRSLPPHPAR